MATYITLLSYTDQGARNIKDAPQRTLAAKSAVESAGCKWLGYYLTMGEYDGVVISEAPSDELYATIVLAIASQGNIRTTTLKAFNEEEMARIIAAIPSG